jgi:hypothetical protein
MSEFDIDADEAEIARIMCKLPEFSWLDGAELSKIRHEIRHKISDILCQYYLENTQNTEKLWTEKFTSAGITEDEGKSAIACARRLGINIR